MTTVYVRTRLDAMTSGQKLRVLVKGEEPKRNVSSAVRALGHEIIEENNANLDSDRYCMLIIKS
ncbi:sulfurtransferase TusA family protein [Gluconobacter thailandicus]|nr:sulfurtransferase TusA family protein [Gluconobacter thailandicus]